MTYLICPEKNSKLRLWAEMIETGIKVLESRKVRLKVNDKIKDQDLFMIRMTKHLSNLCQAFLSTDNTSSTSREYYSLLVLTLSVRLISHTCPSEQPVMERNIFSCFHHSQGFSFLGLILCIYITQISILSQISYFLIWYLGHLDS